RRVPVPQLRSHLPLSGGCLMWKWLLLYVPLAVLTNTAFPLSFEPVLIWFASRCHPQQVGALVVVGALCAGVGGLIDLKLSAVLRPKVADNRWVDLLPEWGGGKFYLLAFLFALLAQPRPAELGQPDSAAGGGCFRRLQILSPPGEGGAFLTPPAMQDSGDT